MRAVMRETLGLLALGSLEELWQGQIPTQPLSLTYLDLAQLRPRYAASSWRVTLNKMVQQRQILKVYRQGRVAFQIAKQGWQEFQALNPIFWTRLESEWSLAIYRSFRPQNKATGQARRLLAQAGYQVIQNGIACRPNTTYSDYLPRQLSDLGYNLSIISFSPSGVRSTSIQELLITGERPLNLLREREKISRNISEVLMKLNRDKILKNQSKEHIGGMLISGLTFIQRLRWFDLGEGDSHADLLNLISQLDALMRQYALKK